MNTWRDLAPSTRKALLQGEPAGDPDTDRIARAYAEKRLGRSQLKIFLIGIPIGLVVGLLLGLLVAMLDLPFGIVAPVLVAVWLGYWFFEARRKLALVRLLNVSQGAPRVPVVPGVQEGLEIRVPTVGVLRMMLPFLGTFAIPVAAGLLLSAPAITAAAAVLAIPVIAYFGHLLSWSIPGHPTVLDADGVHSPKDGVRVSWEAVREIRVVPLRATAGDSRQVIAFMLHDDETYLRQLPRWQALLAKMNKKTYLSPLVFMDSMVDKSIAEIAASAAAWSGIAVSKAG
ncbi:hypothetical protein [Nocardia jinanensis]|uniref:Uncharacterized protein n=1 Tax=Nocardia jinanensis TaxID=382504 RepID=A0A917RZV4_9NOCA|nr:hypothetical protein [Nocardia jinanensis]GGL45863.1 hypothetical protein GCM10011588_70770 [Nocardia jinanensis]